MTFAQALQAHELIYRGECLKEILYELWHSKTVEPVGFIYKNESCISRYTYGNLSSEMHRSCSLRRSNYSQNTAG
ncbi:hypothetical protein CDL12_01553 [Handroanthus impetiginosus]|uniref:Uncharacterized protein n=1 Tax=Handroanthus impetiginosus TaxID=429701 RepID=A0A2G9I7T2_9LAMI|nr:hypothetical protein CDL12_01553 [Handroanthus impetiginosus]